MGEPFGKPPVPPPITHDKEIVTRFSGWIVSNGSAKGGHRFTIGVPGDELWKAMLMVTDKRLLHFEVYAPEKVEVDGDEELMKALGLDVPEGNGVEIDWEAIDG